MARRTTVSVCGLGPGPQEGENNASVSTYQDKSGTDVFFSLATGYRMHSIRK